MRGLSVFITDLRACMRYLIPTHIDTLGRTRELEEKRINKEFAHIRAKFKGTSIQ